MIRFGDVVIDPAFREVRVAERVEHLEPQAFDVLWLLAVNRHRVVPKAEILDTVWGDQFVSESALTTRVKEVRRAVGDDGRTQHVIKNLRGTGYRFVADAEGERNADRDGAPVAPVSARHLRLKPNRVERSPGQPISYATVGSGPPLVFMPGWISSLDAFADGTDPRSPLVARLADHFSVTVFDRFGTGLSSAVEVDTSLDGSVAEVGAILRAVTTPDRPAVLFASSAAGPAAAIASADNELVDRVVFMCTYACGPTIFTNATSTAYLIELVEESWGLGSRVIADMVVPGIDAITRSVFARFQRRTARPEVAAGYIRQLYEADATAALASIDRPCLIMHYRDDPAIPYEGSRQIANGIADTELVPLDGPYHTAPAHHIEHIASNVRAFVARS